jgi:3-mercaptopyruvate sulfurtransferase SseA
MADRDRFLATTSWLADNLGRPNLRILECTVLLRPRADGTPGWDIVPGREEWAAAHIPGSMFADIPGELSDRSQRLQFMMPSAEQFATAMAAYGVGDDSEVVLYDREGNMWAARVWWMLRTFGFDNARVLDGGWRTWSNEGRPVSTAIESPQPGDFTPRPRPSLIATKDDVLAAITSGPVVAAVFEGTSAIQTVRGAVGSTNPAEAAPGSIRADFGLERGRNLVHASDSPESGVRESQLFFKPEELIGWSRDTDRWIFE